MRWIAVVLAAAALAGCQTSATEDHGNGPAAAATPAPPASAGDAEPLRLDSNEAAALLGVEPAKKSGDGPLTLDGAEAAALLGIAADAGGETAPPPAGKVADNSRCLVCHGNFEDEELSVTHAKHDVGCEKCHGPSDAHCDDENNITPPEIMYPKDEIDPACRVCHDETKVVDGALFCLHVLTPAEKGKRCTDCHGKHAMSVRTVQWDKKTGKLLKGGWMEESEKK